MVYCFELALRPLLGKILASNPSRKIPTRMAISVISTLVLDIVDLGANSERVKQ
jgi:hypothetical protein